MDSLVYVSCVCSRSSGKHSSEVINADPHQQNLSQASIRQHTEYTAEGIWPHREESRSS